ncbi:hypothetical protein [Fischerella sp. PCC 9605]|uniref:hypothetical protein n=1 Tax=Fischerella sp. PCC 9605 TaxID=1173024 RepID=UPI001E4C3682|nr:hypothetical protein [Fischerella sp. PCC 9605]
MVNWHSPYLWVWVRDELGVVQKDPNREVINRINLVFEIFGQRKSASKVLQTFNSEGLLLPRRNRFGDIFLAQA